ncbi:MAG TPA: DUF1564 family protein [Leptospiraceae bacterium]|nr:DUF1564 family protein [Leptospiraceae bacterium]HMW08174.1 DUF1564 family protein [Leptospiraceae bacterium]HMX35263.1 DUF1564 family protein [Leptospiraceae bacterium]HMY33977.1 DUF1564 family protein [Leptospiraceae bacterium]HNA09395.1 DUF1564 family protein [Leptospiraceae bacterium]
MILIQNSNTFPIQKERFLSEKSVSTLLVPAHLVPFLKSKSLSFGSLNTYFKFLLSQYRIITHSGLIPYPASIKTQFQKNNLGLTRVSFRVDNDDWIELGELSIAFGKSRCWLFTYLLELDFLGLWEILSKTDLINEVPTVDRLGLRASWSFRRTDYIYKRSYYVRI